MVQKVSVINYFLKSVVQERGAKIVDKPITPPSNVLISSAVNTQLQELTRIMPGASVLGATVDSLTGREITATLLLKQLDLRHTSSLDYELRQFQKLTGKLNMVD